MPKRNTFFFDFIRLVVAGSIEDISRILADHPSFAVDALQIGATRQNPRDFFFTEISHYIYERDTALHMAAAAFRRPVAELLIARGADRGARNRRGATPLHYAADTNHWDPKAQVETITYLIAAGSDPNAVDKSGVAPLHRAVRTRSLPAVRALLDGGANIAQTNKSGSTPMDLAMKDTGRGGSGTPLAREQQKEIIKLLRERGGASATKSIRK